MTERKGRGGVERRFGQAVEVFEKAVKAMGRKDFDRARELLGTVLEEYGEEQDVAERARAYLAMCQRARERERRSPRPKSVDDLLLHGVVLHNRGEFAEAVKTLRQASDLDPRSEHVQYCLAAALARTGLADEAVKALRLAIAANPANRTQARADGDFEALRTDAAFLSLIANHNHNHNH